MGVLTFWSGKSTQSLVVAEKKSQLLEVTPKEDSLTVPGSTRPLTKETASVEPSKPDDDPAPPPQSAVATEDCSEPTELTPPKRPNDQRRFSFRSFPIFNGPKEHKPVLTTREEHEKEKRAAEAYIKHAVKQSSSDKRAKESALIVRSLIIGPSSISPTSPKVAKAAVTKPQIGKVKAQLLEPKSANKVIAQLRQLPVSDGEYGSDSKDVSIHTTPIHAVCLPFTESEVQSHFDCCLLEPSQPGAPEPLAGTAGVSTATITALASLFEGLHLVNLLTAPDLGLGHAVGSQEEGILSGALPTPETVIKGITQITPQLMSLGYATGKIVAPSHTGVYPPTDRMSVLTYWWGLEVVMPPPTLSYLGDAASISHNVINVLTALAMVDNGVREIMPFVRYISQYIDFEWGYIKGQDQGKGVVCAATWIMPAAMVPRPWDFPPPPPPEISVDPQPLPLPKPDSQSPSVPLPAHPGTLQTDAINPLQQDSSVQEPGTPPPHADDGPEIPTTPPPLPALTITPPSLSKKTGLAALEGAEIEVEDREDVDPLSVG